MFWLAKWLANGDCLMSVTSDHHTDIGTLPDVTTLQNPPTACKDEKILHFKILTHSFRIIYIQKQETGQQIY